MFNKDTPIKPFIFLDEINEIVEEKGNQFAALRKVQWIKEDEQPDASKAKLELRKWMVDKDGSEKANKGYTFMTPEGPHQLAEILVEKDYGKTSTILKSISKREDFRDALNDPDNEEFGSDGEYFDMRETLLSYSNEDNDDESDE